MSEQAEAELADVIRRMAATDNQCAAPLVLWNAKQSKWYEWDTCTSPPGHEGPHEVYSDRDSDVWATWGSGVEPHSPYADLRQPYQDPGSPWTVVELERRNTVLDEHPSETVGTE